MYFRYRLALTQLGHPERNVHKYSTKINLMAATSAYIELYNLWDRRKSQSVLKTDVKQTEKDDQGKTKVLI